MVAILGTIILCLGCYGGFCLVRVIYRFIKRCLYIRKLKKKGVEPSEDVSADFEQQILNLLSHQLGRRKDD